MDFTKMTELYKMRNVHINYKIDTKPTILNFDQVINLRDKCNILTKGVTIPEFNKKYKYSEFENSNTKNIQYMNTAKENCKNEYFRAVATLKKYGFEIYHVEKRLLEFKNRTVCCCANYSFIFYCKMNNMTLIFKFKDDGDLHPGALRCIVFSKSNNYASDIFGLVNTLAINFLDYYILRYFHF